MKPKVYIDGQAGTTGLKIIERLSTRDDLEILKIDDSKRHDNDERAKLINSSDITFLCLPDDAAREAVTLVENPNTVIIDASTAHRTNPEWAYGFPELSDKFRENIATSKRIANPGCYASGFISLVYPLVANGIISKDALLTSFAVSGYSGGGKKMIAEYESDAKTEEENSPKFYGLAQNHKHLPEMQVISGLSHSPLFTPIVDDYYSGIVVAVPLFKENINCTIKEVVEMYAKHYENAKMVSVNPLADLETQKKSGIYTNTLSGKNNMEITVYGNDEKILLTSRFDNLGKGASGAAVQCMNISLGVDETTGLL